MVTTAKPKTPAEMRAERLQELDAIQQMQAQYDADRAAMQAESDAFSAKATAYHEALERGEQPVMPPVPTINGIFEADTARIRAEAEAAEAARIAALTPRELLFSALPASKKDFIERWQNTNKGQQFPLEALPYL